MVALGALEAHILDPDAACGLGQVGEQAADDNQDQSGNRQRPSAAHGGLPFARAFEPALGLALQVRFGCD
jgi:hypothetical protein